jgi:hypothetical protein
MGRCPPGVLCIENATLLIVVIIAIGVILFIQNNTITKITNDVMFHSKSSSKPSNHSARPPGIFSRMNYSFSDAPDDVLLNPYKAPLRDDRIFQGNLHHNRGDVRGIPINIATQSVDTTYRQVGILTRINGGEMILPLLGRPLITNRDKWNFYTMSDKNNIVKLPVTHKGKSCTNEYGCDNLYNGDTVYVEGYNDAFKVTMYDNQVMKYIPFL